MIPLKTIEELISKHALLENDLSSGNIDKKLFAEKSKEYSDLNEIINDAKKYISYENNRLELQKILEDKGADKELIKMAEIELNSLKLENEKNEKKLRLFLLPKDEADKKNAIIEIRAGTGGLEASLFASDLFKMYEKISNKKKWTVELISISKNHFFLLLTFSYILKRSEANKLASKPPVPALISIIAFFLSASSFGNKNNFNFFSLFLFSISNLFNSVSAIFIISWSESSSSKIV